MLHCCSVQYYGALITNEDWSESWAPFGAAVNDGE